MRAVQIADALYTRSDATWAASKQHTTFVPLRRRTQETQEKLEDNSGVGLLRRTALSANGRTSPANRLQSI